MKRLVAAAALALCPSFGHAQLSPPIPCVMVSADGRVGAPGFAFVSIMDGRLSMLLTRNREGASEATDFQPVPTRPGTSYFQENYEVRIGERPRSLFILATIRDDGTILVEHWDRTNPRPTEFGSYSLRCNR